MKPSKVSTRSLLGRVACLLYILRFADSQASAPGPATESTSELRCRSCPGPVDAEPLGLSLEIVVETDVAQFFASRAEGSLLVYFVARANFSHAPAQLQLTDFQVQNGSVLEILAENSCNQFLLKGTVQQREAWLANSTEVSIQTSEGDTTDCRGNPFPAAKASSISRNGPVGSMYVPNMAYTAAGPLTTAATNFVRIAFSEPVTGLAVPYLNISLTKAPDTLTTQQAANSRRLHQAVAPASIIECVPAYQTQVLPAVTNSSQFFNIFITLPECFYGLVTIGFSGQVTNSAGLKSLPIKAVGYNRVATRIPVDTVSSVEQMPPLGKALGRECF